MTTPEYWYRYDDIAVYDRGCVITLRRFTVLRHTPCGVWLVPDYHPVENAKRWCSNTARKRFACKTKKAALESFIVRKKRQVEYLTYALDRAHSAQSQGAAMMAKQLEGDTDEH